MSSSIHIADPAYFTDDKGVKWCVDWREVTKYADDTRGLYGFFKLLGRTYSVIAFDGRAPRRRITKYEKVPPLSLSTPQPDYPDYPKALMVETETEPEVKRSGSKYHRIIQGFGGDKVTVDVYRVIDAFAVTDPGIQHALKKLLCAGIRGKGDCQQDLSEAIDAVQATLDKLRE